MNTSVNTSKASETSKNASMNTSARHEVKIHGSFQFPYIVYHGKIPDFLLSFPMHWHEEMEFIVVTEGSLHISIYNERLVLDKDDVAIIFPKVPHSIDRVDDQHNEYFNILFDYSIFRQNDTEIYKKYLEPFFAQIFTVDKIIKSKTELHSEIHPHLVDLIRYRHESYESKELMILGKLYLIMNSLFEHKKKITAKELLLTSNMDKIKLAVYEIQRNYNESISIKKISNMCGYSESHFMKIFRDVMGVSFTSYLVNYRLEAAARLIENSDDKIINIALNCGFNNPSYFTRAFTKYFGVTPAIYRQQKKGL